MELAPGAAGQQSIPKHAAEVSKGGGAGGGTKQGRGGLARQQ